MKTFQAAFNAAGGDEFPFVRFVGAEYSGADNVLSVRFLKNAAAVEDGRFNDETEKKINGIVASLIPPGIPFGVKYTKVSSDEDTVRAALIREIQRFAPAARADMGPEDVLISVSRTAINVKIMAEKALCSILSAEGALERIASALGENFVETVNLETGEKYVSEEERAGILKKGRENLEKTGITRTVRAGGTGGAFNGPSEGVSVTVPEGARQIAASTTRCVLGNSALKCAPMYLSDVTAVSGTVVVCGKAENVFRREYDNKNYGQKPPARGGGHRNYTDPKLPMYTFTLSDTTARLAAVCFPGTEADAVLAEFLMDDVEIVCQGRVSERNGEKQIVADRIWLADIDFSSVKRGPRVKKRICGFRNVFPVPFEGEEEQGRMEDLLSKRKPAPYLNGRAFVVFDLETTGKDPAECEIVQIGAIRIVDGVMTERFGTLVNPGVHIPEDSTKIHGITDADVRNAYAIEDVLPDFLFFVGNSTLVGHYVLKFDCLVLRREAGRLGLSADNPVLDTHVIARQNLRLPKYTLEALAEHLMITAGKAHDAEGDALTAARVFMALAKYLK